MALTSGTRLGPYDITAQIDVGEESEGTKVSTCEAGFKTSRQGHPHGELRTMV